MNQITTNYLNDYIQKCINKRTELEKEKEKKILCGYDTNFNTWIPNIPTTCPICAEEKSDEFIFCNHCSIKNKDIAVCYECFIKMKNKLDTSRIIEFDLEILFELNGCLCGKQDCSYFKYKVHSIEEINTKIRKPYSELERTSIQLVNDTVLKKDNNIFHSVHKINLLIENLFPVYECIYKCKQDEITFKF